MRRLLLLALTIGLAALGADLNGTWKATAEGPNGTMERTFVFKVEGDRLTGETTSSMMGKSVIAGGKVDGDTVSFTITVKFGDTEMKLNYKGRVAGDEIRLTAENAATGQTLEWKGKKVS